MGTIKFNRRGSDVWEEAYTVDHLKLKLGDDQAVVIYPKNQAGFLKRIIEMVRSIFR